MKSNRYVFLLPVLMLLLSSCDLLGIGGDDDNNNKTPSLAWQTEFTGNVAPVIDNNSVYVLGSGLTSVALETGDEQWKMPLQNAGNSLRNLLLTNNAAVVGLTQTVQAFAKEDGSLLWSTSVNLASDPQDTSLVELTAGLPMAETSSQIFIGGQHKVVALRKAGGAKEFDIALDTLAQNGQTVRITSLVTGGNSKSLVFAATQHNTENQFQTNGNIVAINANTGKVQWSVHISDIANSPVAVDLAISGDKLIVLSQTEVIALKPSTGTIDWQTPLGNEFAQFGTELVADGDAIFVNASPANIFRLGSTDGAVIWKTTLEDSDSVALNTGGMILNHGRIYYPFFITKNNRGIAIVETEEGAIVNRLQDSDIKGTSVDFSFSLGTAFDVKTPYLIQESAVNTYGIKLE